MNKSEGVKKVRARSPLRAAAANGVAARPRINPEAQRDFLEKINDIVMAAPNARGKGVYWWEPGNTRGRGFFDEAGNVLPVFDVFHKYTRPIHRTDGQ